MAPRTVHGRTPWGAYFIETLLSHYDEGRLQRGRTYANTGRVAAVVVSGPEIKAKVEGNYNPWYRVSLHFPAFTAAERMATLDLIRSRPALLSAIVAGELPMELIGELAAAGIDLLPRDWDRLARACDCPDVGDPCKHMAAVYYTLAREIDQNPFAIFLLRGLDLRAEFPVGEADALPPPLALRPRPADAAVAVVDPEFSLNDSYVPFIISVLRPAPAFCAGDFKTVLAEFYHRSARAYEFSLTVGRHARSPAARLPAGRRLSECECTLAAPAGLQVSHPVSGQTMAGGTGLALLDAAPAFLSAEEAGGTASYRYFYHLYRLLFLILRAGAFVPAPDQRGQVLRVLWKPLFAVADVAACVDSLASICPPLLELERKGTRVVWADGRSTTEKLLSDLCTAYVRSLSFPDGPKRLDPVAKLFFGDLSLRTDAVAYRSTPRAIASWLAVLDRRVGDFRYRFRIAAAPGGGEDTESRTYRLGVELRRTEEAAWTSLRKASGLADAVEAFSFASMLASYLPELAALQKSDAVDLDEERLLFFLREAAPTLRRLGAEVVLPKELGRELRPRLTVAASAKGGGNLVPGIGLPELLDYDWRIAVGDAVYGLKEFKALLKEGRKVVRLKDGFLTLDPEEIRRLLERSGRKPVAADAVAAFLEGAEAFSEEARTAFGAILKGKETPVPAGLRADLRHYQLSGFRWAWNNLSNGFGCLLADDMGLGKTVQAIAVALKLKEEGRLGRGALVVVPASLMTNWRRELGRFAPDLSLHDYYGPRRAFAPDADVHLSTYETVLRDSEKLTKRKFSLLVLDEAHGLKNAATKRAQAVRTIKSEAKLALSGTPVENRLEDLRSVMDLVLPGYLGDAASFRRTWRVPIELHRDAGTAEALRRVTAPFLLRRLKTDPAVAPDLPEKTTIDEYASLTPVQAALYESVLSELAGPKSSALEDPAARGAVVLKLLTALKQVCNHPRAYDGDSPPAADLSGKTRLLLDLLSSMLEGGEKVLVFSQYVETLSILKTVIEADLGEACLVLHGGLSAAERTRAVDRFQTEGAYRVLLISLKAGGVGLNLTAASRVVHYDLWFNPAVENQATDRAFRIGQSRNVFVHRLICANTFEEKIDALIKSKRELADLSVAQGESWLADLKPEEIRALFSRSTGR
jgi:superfamily II DNA or RNA helicase